MEMEGTEGAPECPYLFKLEVMRCGALANKNLLSNVQLWNVNKITKAISFLSQSPHSAPHSAPAIKSEPNKRQ